jgi:hypothetical protein
LLAPYPSRIVANILRDKRKKLIFVIGNGFYPVSDIQNEEAFFKTVRAHYGASRVARWSEERRDRERWKYLEYARFYTYNITPSFGYFLLSYLIDQQHVKAVLTTNYDLFLNSVLDRTSKPRDSYCFNPTIGDADFDWQGYYSQGKPTIPSAVRIFKIHGSLSHVVFRNCRRQNNQPHIFRLPSFMVGFDTRQMRQDFGIKYLHDYLGHTGLKYRDATLVEDEEYTGYYVHYIDWAVKGLCTGGVGYRDFFSKEIEFAKRELEATADIGAVIIIGLTGYYNSTDLTDEYNEELSPVIRSLLSKVPVFHFLHQRQHANAALNPNGLYLWKVVESFDHRHVVQYTDADELMLNLICNRQTRLRNRLRATYDSDWINGKLFINRGRL